MNHVEHFCQGESHKLNDKPCQDYAYAETSDNLSIAIVCDGHGGERYFRSQIGAKYATEITKDAIHTYVKEMPSSFIDSDKAAKSVFDGTHFTKYSEAIATDLQVNTQAHESLIWLFSSIISQWNNRISQHAKENDLTEWELEHVEKEYQDDFREKRTLSETSFEKTYGCTLMAYVQTPDYWFAFQIGDGKFVSMHLVDGKITCEQPIPWDERCFLNKTTSLCDANAKDEFRYCYEGNGKFPVAVFLGSDGIDDTYGDGSNLYNFYIKLLEIIIRNGQKYAQKELVVDLPKISKLGSKDDMSVVCIYNENEFEGLFSKLTGYQKDELKHQIDLLKKKISELEDKIKDLGDCKILEKSQQISLDYAKKDLEKAKHHEKKLGLKLRSIKGVETKYNNSLKEKADSASSEQEDSILNENDNELSNKQ